MTYIPQDATWYLANLVQEISVEGEPKKVIHKNLVLIHADSPEKAFEKAIELGAQSELQYENPKGQAVQITFRGLNELCVIYDKLEHGAELQYEEIIGPSTDEIEKLLRRKEDLAVFRTITSTDRPDFSSKEILEKAAQLLEGDTHS